MMRPRPQLSVPVSVSVSVSVYEEHQWIKIYKAPSQLRTAPLK